MNERRIENRLLCADLVQLIWTDASGRENRKLANLEDISLSGLCLQVETALPEGTAITMPFGQGKLVGIVRYCTFRFGSYFLGVELGEGCRWSPSDFRPEHLLDPRELLDETLRRREHAAELTLQARPA